MTAKKSKLADPEEALALMQQGRVRGQRRRSPIVVWMQKNQAVLERGFSASAPSWAKLAAYLGDHDILDGDGKRPTAVATRQAWYRVRSMAAAKPKPLSPLSVRQIQPAGVTSEPEDDAPTSERPTFTFATLRNHTPATPKPEPATRPEPVKRDVDAELRRLLGNKATTKLPPPDQED